MDDTEVEYDTVNILLKAIAILSKRIYEEWNDLQYVEAQKMIRLGELLKELEEENAFF